MMSGGFTQEDFEEGWRLLRATSPAHLDTVKTSPVAVQREAITQLEAWAKRHIRLVEVAVKNRYPKLHERIYSGLPQLEDYSVVLGVTHFLDRLAAAEGDDGAALRALLEKRGLDAAAIARAREWVAAVTSSPPDAPETNYQPAEDAVWRWYQEWAAVARETIEDRRILIRLGLVSSRVPKHQAEAADDPAGQGD